MRFVSLLVFSLLLAFGAGAAELAANIPFTLANGFMLVKAQLGERKESLVFLIDSGASVSVISTQAARRLHLGLGEAEKVRGVGVEVEAFHIRPQRVAAQGVELAKVDLIVGLEKAQDLCGQPIDGLVGADFFASRTVQFDYTGRQMRLLAQPASTEGATTLPLRARNGVYLVGVSVNGSQPRWTRVDTGCNDSLHWVVPRVAGRKHRDEVSLGFTTDERDVTPVQVQLGSLALDNVQTSLHGKPLFPDEAGLLGNGLLCRFLVTIDAPHHRLVLAGAGDSQ